jgi:Malonyl-CoA decarboxylase C-terminal domain
MYKIINNRDPNFKLEWLDNLKHDPVHPIDPNKPLERRIADDRLIFVMLLDDAPVAMIQVALCDALPGTIDQIFKNPILQTDPTCAVFYSVFKLPDQPNLQGLAEKLVYGAARAVHSAYDTVQRFVTFSPIPTLAKNLTDFSDDSVWGYIKSKKDPVTKFHTKNGAEPVAVWPNADRSDVRVKESAGWMVSYEYKLPEDSGSTELRNESAH